MPLTETNYFVKVINTTAKKQKGLQYFKMNIQVQKGPKVTKEIYIKLNWLHSAGGKVFSAGDVTHELSSDLLPVRRPWMVLPIHCTVSPNSSLTNID